MTVTPAVAPSPLSAAAERRARAKLRFYVLCQVLGWGGFFLMQMVIYSVFPRDADPRSRTEVIASVVMVMTSGILITHYTRRFFSRWGWKDLGWRAEGRRESRAQPPAGPGIPREDEPVKRPPAEYTEENPVVWFNIPCIRRVPWAPCRDSNDRSP